MLKSNISWVGLYRIYWFFKKINIIGTVLTFIIIMKESSLIKTVWNIKLDWTWKMQSKILPDFIRILLWHIKLGWSFDTSGTYWENRSKLQMCEKILLWSFSRIFFPNLLLTLCDLEQHKLLQNILHLIFIKYKNDVLH